VLPASTDVVFLALHGTYGEDGTVQARLDALASLTPAAMPKPAGWDSTISNQAALCRGAVPTARFTPADSPAAAGHGLEYLQCVKTRAQGSSVGLQLWNASPTGASAGRGDAS